jgi:hypothetical protein
MFIAEVHLGRYLKVVSFEEVMFNQPRMSIKGSSPRKNIKMLGSEGM